MWGIKKSDKKETGKRKNNSTDSRWSRRNRGKSDWADKRNWDGAGVGGGYEFFVLYFFRLPLIAKIDRLSHCAGILQICLLK